MHHIYTTDYKYNIDKKAVQDYWDKRAAADNKEGSSGLLYGIRWLNNVICDSEDEAYEKIDKLDRGNYDQLAILYRHYPDIVPTKKLSELAERLRKARNTYYSKENAIHYKNVKSEYIGCKSCGSRIASKYINYNKCPICKEDLRPQSTLDSIKNAHENYKKIKKQYKEEEKKVLVKNTAKSELRWLVKVEYHV